MSGYKEALEAAGATVHAFKEFGSYQGRWYARVTYKGEDGWINDWYGSCSGCDAFEADVGYCWSDDESAKAQYQARLADFGKSYLEGKLKSHDEIISEVQKESEYSCDADEAMEWIKAN